MVILSDGTDTRDAFGLGAHESERESHSAMSVFLESLLGNGDTGDDYATDDMGSGIVRWGRRVLTWDDRGFYYYTRFETAETAARAWAETANQWSTAWEDE